MLKPIFYNKHIFDTVLDNLNIMLFGDMIILRSVGILSFEHIYMKRELQRNIFELNDLNICYAG